MSFHLFDINELYSSADGQVQYIEMKLGTDFLDDERFWQNRTITATQNGVTHSFIFPTNLPGKPPANTTVLIATQGFVNLGIVTPDYIVPAGFLFVNGGTVDFAGVDIVTYTALPVDGIHSIDASGASGTATPKNFFGVTASLPSPNHTPTGADNTITGNEDVAHTFAASDFGFTDVDSGDTLSAVRIDTLPGAGSLTLSGVAVSAAQVITTANLGNLVFTPAANANGNGYASFSFSVRDQSSAFDTVPNTITVNLTAVNDAPSGAVSISGNVTQGQTLTAANTLADADGLGSIGYQWQADGLAIIGATADTYALRIADIGKTITVLAGYVDGGGTSESVASGPTTAVLNSGVGTAGDDLFNGGAGNDIFDGAQGNDTLNGGDGNDNLGGGAGFDSLTGGNGDDTLRGGEQADTLNGGDGNDSLSGGKGFDFLFGGNGNDTLAGLAGSDIVDGGPGFDMADYSLSIDGVTVSLALVGAAQVVSAGSGTDVLTGIEGLIGSGFNDVLTGDITANVLTGNGGADIINGDFGNDSIDGGDGDDLLLGGFNADVITGGPGNDTLGGGNGFDNLSGGDGDDSITGGLGADTVTGGLGADRFVFRTALNVALNIDLITDFVSATDMIELSATIFTAFAGQEGQTVGLSANLTYDNSNGALAYDADGAGAGVAVIFAVLGASPHPASIGNDFVIAV